MCNLDQQAVSLPVPDSNTIEEWRWVVDYEGYYEVSNLGRVRSVPRTVLTRGRRRPYPGKFLAVHLDRGNYQKVGLCRNGNVKMYMIHRLVAAAFIGPLQPGHQVNHRDGNKQHNRPNNLEYTTPDRNSQHALRMGLRVPLCGSALTHARLTEDAVVIIRRDYEAGIASRKELARRFGVHVGTIGYVLRGASWRHVPGFDKPVPLPK